MSNIRRMSPNIILPLMILIGCSTEAVPEIVDTARKEKILSGALYIPSDVNIAYEIRYSDCPSPSALLSNGKIISANSKGSPLPLFSGENIISTQNNCEALLSIYSLSFENSLEALYVGPADLVVFRSPAARLQTQNVMLYDARVIGDNLRTWSQERSFNRRQRWESFKGLVGGDGPDTRRILERFPVSGDSYGDVGGLIESGGNSLVSIQVPHSRANIKLVFNSSIYASESVISATSEPIAYDEDGREVWSVLLVETQDELKPVAMLTLSETLEALRAIESI